MQTTSSGVRVRWHTIVIAALTVALLWLFFRNVDFVETWRAVGRADLTLIAAAIAVTFATYLLRAVRWLALLRPIGRARFSIAFRTTVIGFTTTFLLPGRIGEVLRPYLLARHEGMKASATFATVIVERLLDTVTVLLMFALAIVLSGIDVGASVRLAGWIAALVAVVALAVLFVLAGHPERLGRWTARLTRRLPSRIAEPAAHFAHAFAEGLAVMRSPANLASAMSWSLAVWASIAAGIWFTSHAFDLTVTWTGSFLVIGYLAVGVAVPTPGGAGGFHLMYKQALTQFFGADPDVAAAAAIVLHAISFVPITIIGLVFMWQDGLTFGGLRAMRAEAQAAESQ
jgi:uncharacterized protein (TIRG00374 family)